MFIFFKYNNRYGIVFGDCEVFIVGVLLGCICLEYFGNVLVFILF